MITAKMLSDGILLVHVLDDIIQLDMRQGNLRGSETTTTFTALLQTAESLGASSQHRQPTGAVRP